MIYICASRSFRILRCITLRSYAKELNFWNRGVLKQFGRTFQSVFVFKNHFTLFKKKKKKNISRWRSLDNRYALLQPYIFLVILSLQYEVLSIKDVFTKEYILLCSSFLPCLLNFFIPISKRFFKLVN